MENISISKRSVRTPEKTRTNINEARNSQPYTELMPVSEKLDNEVDENFLNYLHYIGLAEKENQLVLSSKLHYYYDYEELRSVETLISLKKLNLIKHLDDFLNSINSGLSPKTNFVGCFSDRKSERVNMTTRFYKRFINFLDARIDVEIDGKSISRILESHGFKVIDMTEINGLTYFRTQNISSTAL
jgi:hypothetical protein